MRFRYRLQKIVDLKSSEKKQAEWILSDALARLKLEEQSLADLRSTRSDLEQMIHDASSSGTSAQELVMLEQYIQHIDLLIADKMKMVEQAQQQVEKKSEQLVEKMKDEKIWLKARERSLQAFRAAFLRQEQAIIDETAVARFGKS